MRMRPILMSAPMVLATLANTKTVTRRLKGLEYINDNPDEWTLEDWSHVSSSGMQTFLQATFHRNGGPHMHVRCPYGLQGDGLWVRENFRYQACYDRLAPSMVPNDLRVWFEADGEKPDWAGRLRPSIHMPRSISRLDLELGNIHPERLMDISEGGARREGVKRGQLYFKDKVYFKEEAKGKYLDGFRYLWNEINPKMSFEYNPWVFVINYKRLKT